MYLENVNNQNKSSRGKKLYVLRTCKYRIKDKAVSLMFQKLPVVNCSSKNADTCSNNGSQNRPILSFLSLNKIDRQDKIISH